MLKKNVFSRLLAVFFVLTMISGATAASTNPNEDRNVVLGQAFTITVQGPAVTSPIRGIIYL